MATETTTTSQPPVPFLKLKEIAHEVRTGCPSLLPAKSFQHEKQSTSESLSI